MEKGVWKINSILYKIQKRHRLQYNALISVLWNELQAVWILFWYVIVCLFLLKKWYFS